MTQSECVPGTTGGRLQHLFVVLNPVAGHLRAPQLRDALERHCESRGWTYNIYETSADEDVSAMIRSANQHEIGLVVAAGGDGTAAEVANGLAGTSIPLGILPVGTGNMLARALGIPLDLDDAIQLLLGEHRLQPLDGMLVGERTYILNVSAGISARMMRDTSPAQKRRFGMLAYIWTTLRKLPALRPRRFRLTVDGRQVDVRASEVLITNGAFLQAPPFPMGPVEKFNDGTFDIYLLTAERWREHLALAWELLRRPAEPRRGLKRLRVHDSIRIATASGSEPVQADGELIGRTPVAVKLVRDALHVVVP